jgi:prolyl oligopeptidase
MAQRPDLARVAVPQVGVLDMLRYHRFTAGAGWAYDYGTPEESEAMFRYLLDYSPYHNLREGIAYPATLVMTGDHDDRVAPAHSFKFAARLQHCHAGDAPVLIRIATDTGHGAGKPLSMALRESADKYAFALWQMGFRTLPASAEKE